MSLQPPNIPIRRISRRALLGSLGAAGLAGGGLLWWQRSDRRRPGFTVHLLPPDSPAGGFAPLSGLQWVIQAHLATLAPACVLAVPNSELLLPANRPAFQLQLQPVRQDDSLALSFRWRRAGDSWHEVTGIPGLPFQAVSTFLAALPEPFAPDREARLLPRSTELAWELFDLASNRAGFSGPMGLRTRLDSLVAKAPDCALAWCIFGRAAYLDLLNRRDWAPTDRAQAELCLKKALTLVPGLPFAAGSLAQMFSDFGENRAALQVLSKAIGVHPHSEVLLRRLAYSARNAGLLEVANHAVLQRESWMGHLGGIENTLLYLGEIGRFEEGILAETRGKAWLPAQRFYMGYAALVRGDRNEALRRLREAKGDWSEARFGRIGFTLWTFLEGRTQESLEALEKLVQEHLTVRTPDGEFILKLAELMVLHGKDNRALDLAARAASHGFGCVQWYERSPLLAPIRSFLRFQALLLTLRERQANLAEHFPPRTFGF